MREAIGSLNLQWQDRPEGADAQYRQFLAAQRRRREWRPELSEWRSPDFEEPLGGVAADGKLG